MTDSLPPQCCTLPPLQSNYKPVGETLTIKGRDGQDLSIYTTGPKNAEYGLICIYDIFGVTPNTIQGADLLAQERGYRVVIPDFFRGATWDHTNFPPKEGFPFLQAWVRKIGAWDLIKPDLVATIDLLKQDGQRSIGVSGILFSCWHFLANGGAHLVIWLLLWRKESHGGLCRQRGPQSHCYGPPILDPS